MDITFSLPHVFNPAASPEENAAAIRPLLDCLIALDLAYLRFHPGTPNLYQSGVYYDRTLTWDTIPALYARGYGDCKSLAAALIAQYTFIGIPAQPVFRWRMNERGERDFHILVLTPTGYEDPSAKLGMTINENAQKKG